MNSVQQKAQSDPIYPELKAAATDLMPQLVAWRRDFHQHPELGFHEVRTAGVVAEHLRDLGLEVSTGIGKTGVVAVVEADGTPLDAPTVMLRFDMDALPIQEETGLPFQSQHAGVMHACGHDGHTAIGMGVAQLLVQHRQALPGRVKLVFQPAEEALGGALAMVNDGVLLDPTPTATFGLHLWSRLPLNKVVVQSGPLWAAADGFEIVVHGRGGHGAVPHETVDAIYIASELVVALQSIVARNLSPTETGVISVCTFASGTASNVIAGEATLTGTVRSFTTAVRDLLFRRIEEVARGVCQAHGATCTVSARWGCPATINSEAGTAVMQQVAEQIIGTDDIIQISPMMVGEDVSEFLNRAPGCFILIGAADPNGPELSPHHNPTFDFDERMLPTGVALLAGAAVAYLRQKAG
ncbi:MAG: amidohydrolase [Caldilineaceae bacterium]|nr:amidohydrolase [Caldilineaceae bacterium]